jgi:hypothetical protein
LRIAHLVGDVLRWQMLIDGMTLAGKRKARMDGLEFVLPVHPYGGLAETHVEGCKNRRTEE